MAGELGKASLDLEANLGPFERNVLAAEKRGDDLKQTLEALAAVSEAAQRALNDIKMGEGQAAKSRVSAEGILQGVRGISDESRTAAREIDRVRITEAQASESDAAGDRIKRNLDDVKDNANQARRALDRVHLRLASMGGGSNRPGYGFGPFGAGYGRLGLLGAAIGVGALTAPAAVPAAAGLLASIPTLAAGGIGALGTLALAFEGVGKAIGGDKKAFDDLQPAAKQFVLTVRSLDGTFDKLRQIAGKTLFPGLTQGLKSALSAGTLNAVVVAVQEFGTAIGKAGAQWGKYFGSYQFQSIFGPLMQSGARNLGVLADTALRLFDALGVLGRAAIPFTNWLTTVTDKAAKYADAWIHAKDASGGLAKGFNEAKKSLILVGGLFKALVDLAGALVRALYPAANVAIKDLTAALEYLAQWVDQNRQGIRDFVGGALAALVSVVKIAWPIVQKLGQALHYVVGQMGGWKTAFQIVIGGFLAAKFVGLAGSIGQAVSETSLLRKAMLSLGSPEVLAALAAAYAAYYALSHVQDSVAADVPTKPFKGLTAPTGSDTAHELALLKAGKKLTRGQRDDLMLAYERGDLTNGYVPTPEEIGKFRNLVHGITPPPFNAGQLTLPVAIQHQLALAANKTGASGLAALKAANEAAIAYYDKLLREPGETQQQKTAILNVRSQYVQALSAASVTPANPYGDNPPFTKNLGPKGPKPPVLPPAAAHAESLASANASRASALGNVGAQAKKYLEAELADLTTADKLIREKYDKSSGKLRTQLFSALTSVENTMRAVRARIAKAVKDGRADSLRLAVDQAKAAVAAATEGSAAYDKAKAAEEKALKSEIAYWKKVGDNVKLSAAARDKAVKIVAADEKALKALLKPTLNQAAENEAQFLSSFADIVSSFAGNAFPTGSGSSKTDTHLYDIKTELREQTPHIKKAARSNDYPATAYAVASAGAITG